MRRRNLPTGRPTFAAPRWCGAPTWFPSRCRPPMLDGELKGFGVLPLVDLDSEGRGEPGGQGFHVPEQHGLEALASPPERELRVLSADHAGPEHVEGVVERRRGKTLAPDVVSQKPCQANVQLAAAEGA